MEDLLFNKRKTDETKPMDEAEGKAPASHLSDSIPDSFTPPHFKETPMARSPFTPPPVPAAPVVPTAQPSAPSQRSMMTSPRETTERRTLVVGRGISVQGTVLDAERLVVEGTVEASMVNGLVELSIAPGGVFKGEVEVEDADIAGVIDGTLTARGTLNIRNTGRVIGTARCRRLQVEDGGQMTGRIEMLTEAAAAPLSSDS